MRMQAAPDEFDFYRRAARWVSIVITVVSIMILPGVAGLWADRRWGANFWAIVGFGVGAVGGFAYLLVATRRPPGSKQGRAGGAADRNGGASTAEVSTSRRDWNEREQ
jgi:hypothetical protein